MKTLGLELAREAVRAVVVERRRGGLHVLDAVTIPTSAGADSIAASLRQLLAAHGRGVGRVIAGLPLADCSVKLLELPATTAENLARIAVVEAPNHLPLPAEQVEYSQVVVDPGEPGGQALVAIVAARRDVLAKALAPLHEAGLEPDAIGVSATALANLYGAEVKRRGVPTAVVYAADDSPELILLDGRGTLRAAHLLSGRLDRLPDDVRRICQAFAAQGRGAVASILVTGARAAEVADALRSGLELPVELGDPWRGSKGGDQRGAAAAEYAVATGLGLRGGETPLQLDLRARQTELAASERRQTSVTTAVVSVLFLAVLLSVGWFYSAYRHRAGALELAREKLADVQRELNSVGGEDPAFLRALEARAGEVRHDSDWLGLLNDLSEQLPGGVALAEITCDAERPLVLRGQALSNAAIAQSVERLAGLKRFADVRLDFADAAKVGDETVINFQITCAWPDRKKAAEGQRS